MEPRAMTGRVTLGNGEVKHLASPGRRLAARIIDVVIVYVGTLILLVLGIFGLAGAIGTGEGPIGAATGLVTGGVFLLFVLFLIYEPTLIALRGQTLGKMAMGIMVVRADDGGVPGWGKAIGRWILPGLLLIIPVVGWLLSLLVYVSLLWDDRRQGWHDKMATTVVIDT